MALLRPLQVGAELAERGTVTVGGAPITPQFAAVAGADGFTKDAAGASRLVGRLLN